MRQDDYILPEDRTQLTAINDSSKISVFISNDNQHDRGEGAKIKLKNAISCINDYCAQQELSQERPEIIPLLSKVQDKLKNLQADYSYWNLPFRTLALFAADDFVATYRLTIATKDQFYIGDSFYILPLVPLLKDSPEFYVLKLSQNSVALFKGTRFSFQNVSVPELPESLQAVVSEEMMDDQLQFHSRSSTAHPRSRRAAIFHGQGSVKDNIDIKKFLRAVENKVSSYMRNLNANGNPPKLLLACTDTLLGSYRELNTYPHLEDDCIPGNFENTSDEELHQKAIGILQDRSDLWDTNSQEIEELSFRKDVFKKDIPQIVSAASRGQIAKLFIQDNLDENGNTTIGKLAIKNLRSEEEVQEARMINLGAIHTLRTKGEVQAVSQEEMPQACRAAAILRYGHENVLTAQQMLVP